MLGNREYLHRNSQTTFPKDTKKKKIYLANKWLTLLKMLSSNPIDWYGYHKIQ